MIDDIKVEVTIPLREAVAFVSRQAKAKDLIDELAATLPNELVTISIDARTFLVGACQAMRNRGLAKEAATISAIIRHAKAGRNMTITGNLRILARSGSTSDLDALVAELYRLAGK